MDCATLRSKLRQRRTLAKYTALCAIVLGVCCSLALIKACSHLCCDFGGQSDPRLQPTILGRGFQLSIRNLAAASREDLKDQSKWGWLWGWSNKPQDETSMVEALAMRAELVAKEAMDRELEAHVTVDAALKRRAKRHKDLVQQLEAKGWDLRMADKLTQVSLRGDCNQLATYLRSTAYLRARAARQELMAGRGILMAAGGAVPLTNTYIALHMLRNVHNCSLPVHIYYNGTGELDTGTKLFFESTFTGVRCINVAKYQFPIHQVSHQGRNLSSQQSGWVLKVLMLYITTFQEVLILDADNVPLADPSFLFEDPGYRKAGSLFWPDFWSSNWHNPGPVYDLLGIKNPWETNPDILTTESGQLVFDRLKHDDVLEWIMFLNLHADMLYSIVWGDKDTYRLAFHLANKSQSFAQVDRRASNAMTAPFLFPPPLNIRKMEEEARDAAKRGEPVSSDSNAHGKQEPAQSYEHAGMVQMAPDGSMLFLHRTAGCKMDPFMEYPPGFKPIDFLTPPLTPRQAAHVHIAGVMFADKFDFERTLLCPPARGMNLTGMAGDCGMLSKLNPGGRGIVYEDVSKFFPIPLFDVAEFPKLQGMLDASMAAFRYVQHEFRRKQVLLGEPAEGSATVAVS